MTLLGRLGRPYEIFCEVDKTIRLQIIINWFLWQRTQNVQIVMSGICTCYDEETRSRNNIIL